MAFRVPYPFHLPAIGFPYLFHLKPTTLSPLLRRWNPKHALRLAGQFSETLIFLFMVNGILQWIQRVFRLKLLSRSDWVMFRRIIRLKSLFVLYWVS
ncbi:hypothetical protein Hanom_Chr03g00195661 [Helianthus anomalus]